MKQPLLRAIGVFATKVVAIRMVAKKVVSALATFAQTAVTIFCAVTLGAVDAGASMSPAGLSASAATIAAGTKHANVAPAKKSIPTLMLEHVERVPTKSFPAETEENLVEFRRDVQRQWKKCLQLNDPRVIQAKDFRVTVRDLCVETSRRTHHLLLISKNWKQFYQRSREQFAWYRSVADADKKTHDIDVRLLPLSMIPMKSSGEFYFPIPKKLLNTY